MLASPRRGIGWPLGVAVASGAPAMVLVAAVPIAQLAGPPSVLVWGIAAVLGFVMAVVFAELASAFPDQGGGVAVLAAQMFGRKRRFLARLGQWSYWLGWSPAMALSAGLIGEYIHAAVAPGTTPWLAWLAAGLLLALSAAVNTLGIKVCGRVQLVLAAAVIAAVALLTVLPLVNGVSDPAALTPFAPPDGWASGEGVSAILGAFFLAAWSAYAAEIALTYAPEHAEGVRTAVRSLLATGAAMVVVCVILPLALFTTIGSGTAAQASSTIAVFQGGASPFGAAVVAAVTIAVLVLGVNTVAVGDSRLLCQMARNGDAWAPLGRLNARGVPRNALVFDVAANAAFLALAVLVTGGSVSAVPLTLLVAANVGYLTSLNLALVAAWLLRRERAASSVCFRAPRCCMTAGLAIAAFNLLLVLGAGAAWGWGNAALGVALLAAVMAALCAPWRRWVSARPGLGRFQRRRPATTSRPRRRGSRAA